MVTRVLRVAGAEGSAVRKCVRLMVTPVQLLLRMLPDRYPFSRGRKDYRSEVYARATTPGKAAGSVSLPFQMPPGEENTACP